MLFSSVIIKIDLYTSKLVTPTIQWESTLRLNDALKKNVSLGCVSKNSDVSCGFVWVCLISVSQFSNWK